MNPLLTATLSGIILGAMGAVGVQLFWRALYRKGRSQVLFLNPTTHLYSLDWYKTTLDPAGNTVVPYDKERSAVLDPKARLHGKTPLHIIETNSGYNLVPRVTEERAEGGLRAAFLSVTDWAMYHQQVATNKIRQGLRANEKDGNEGWLKTAIIIGGFCLVFIIGALIFLLVKIVAVAGDAATASAAAKAATASMGMNGGG